MNILSSNKTVEVTGGCDHVILVNYRDVYNIPADQAAPCVMVPVCADTGIPVPNSGFDSLSA